MNNEIRHLEPQALWGHFADLNAIPRASKREEQASRFVAAFGRSLGLETTVDACGNVLIRKPASPGQEHRPGIVLQGHLDMVHQKNASTTFDFDTEGIRMGVDGDWVKAEGTTLGADNGIGVAAVMTVLASKDLVHPALDALFTIDEETGMSGAKGLEAGVLRARRLLNLDSEDDRELTIGCAGGVDILGRGAAPTTAAPADHDFVEVTVRGLTGGHSGMDIHLGRANANKLMNRFLLLAAERLGARVARVDGGGLRNAIPRESRAVLAVPRGADLAAFVREQATRFQDEYRRTDPTLELDCQPTEARGEVLAADFQGRLLRALYTLPNGIYRMSPAVAGLVQTSNNLARVLVEDGRFQVDCLGRGSVDSEKDDLAAAVRCALELAGAEVRFESEYTGWEPKPDSALTEQMAVLYEEVFGEKPRVLACHAGLECGILGSGHPGMEMISFGPNIRGAHSPDERVQISSVQRFWRYLVRALEKL